MARCEMKETVVREVILSMSEEEALVVRDVLWRVHGSATKSRRGFAKKVWMSLDGVASGRGIGRPDDLEGSLNFEDSEQEQDAD